MICSPPLDLGPICRNAGIRGLESHLGQAPISCLRAGLPRARLPGPGADSPQLQIGTKLCQSCIFPPETRDVMAQAGNLGNLNRGP